MRYDQFTIYDLCEMRDALAILRKYVTWAIEKHIEVVWEIEERLKSMKGVGVHEPL